MNKIQTARQYHITEDEFWQLVDFIDWKKNYILKKDKRRALRSIRQRLFKKFDSSYIELAKEYHQDKYRALMAYYDSYGHFEGLCGDDSWWDFTAHIVGLGKETYLDAFKHPSKYRKMLINDEYEECFSYCFQED